MWCLMTTRVSGGTPKLVFCLGQDLKTLAPDICYCVDVGFSFVTAMLFLHFFRLRSSEISSSYGCPFSLKVCGNPLAGTFGFFAERKWEAASRAGGFCGVPGRSSGGRWEVLFYFPHGFAEVVVPWSVPSGGIPFIRLYVVTFRLGTARLALVLR